MTTKSIDNKMCTFNILLSWRFPSKTTLFGRFSSLCTPNDPPPPQRRKFNFYCRFAVSETSHGRWGKIASCGHDYQPCFDTAQNKHRTRGHKECKQVRGATNVHQQMFTNMRIRFGPPPPTPEFLSKDFCLRPGLEWKFLLRRTWSGQKLLPLRFPGLPLPY